MINVARNIKTTSVYKYCLLSPQKEKQNKNLYLKKKNQTSFFVAPTVNIMVEGKCISALQKEKEKNIQYK